MRVRVNPYQSHQVPSRFTTAKAKWQPYWSNSNRISASVSSAQRPLSCKLFSSDCWSKWGSTNFWIHGPSSPSGGHHGWWRSMKWSKKMVAPIHVKQKRLLNIFPPLVRVTIQFEICETKACHLQLEINAYQFVYGRAFYHYTSPWWVVVLSPGEPFWDHFSAMRSFGILGATKGTYSSHPNPSFCVLIHLVSNHIAWHLI